jgi:hypothetical protein
MAASGSRLVGEHFRSDGTPKRPFPTREAADRHARRHRHDHLTIYHCSFCDGYHFATRRDVGPSAY